MVLAGQPRFFVEAAVGLAIGKIVDLAIGGIVSTGTDIAVGFFELFL